MAGKELQVAGLTEMQELLKDKSLTSQFNAGRHDKLVRYAAEREYAMQIIRGNEDLQKCSLETLRTAMLQVAWSGLSLAPMLGHGYLIPYKPVATFSPGYRGLIHLGYKGGMVKSVQAVRVLSRDRFRVYTANNRRIVEHEEAHGDRGHLVAVYVITQFMNGGEHVQVTDLETILAAEAQSTKKNPKGGMVWRGKFRSEMELKVGIRQAWKYWPVDDAGHLRHAMAVANKFDDSPEFEKDTDPGVQDQELLINETQVLELHAYLTGAEMPSDKADQWLQLLAEAMGLRTISDLPERRYDEAFSRLKDRLRRSKEPKK